MSTKLEQLSFLVGFWKTDAQASMELRQYFTAPHAGAMFNITQGADGEKTGFYEFALISEKGGHIVYDVWQIGDHRVDLTLARAGSGEAVFENLARDFPQRLIYRREANILTVRIESTDGTKSNQWVLRRCPDGVVF